MGGLVRDIEREVTAAGMDASQPPWNLTLAALSSLARRGVTVEEVLSNGE